MHKLALTGDCSWFYILELSHNNIKGFGITTSAERRLKKGYCYPSASIQTFCNLYYGKRSQIQALERWFKNQYRSDLLVLIDRKLEWIDPNSDLNDLQKMIKIIEDRIVSCNYTEIYRIKKEYLPFSPSKVFKDIKDDPAMYLETI
jgi:hypothetical protein